MDKKILIVEIVEDEPSLIEALRNKLNKEGFSVLEARNGKIGLDLALKERPDLILLDIIMPVMDGLTMLQELRKKDEWGKNVPVIILTNLSDDKKVMEAVKEGSYDYLIKSDWSINEVISKVRERLKI